MQPEFAAMETAYHALESLDGAGRRRAVRWLADALGYPDVLTAAEDLGSAAVPAISNGKPVASKSSKKALTAAAAPTSVTKTNVLPEVASRRARPTQRASAVDEGQRAYRRMPPAEELLVAYQRVGTISGLAERYGVPRHTAQGWASRLRREGHDIGRGA